jgi:glutamate synthase (NADPH/NADH) small chain
LIEELHLMEKEGIVFQVNTHVGVNLSAKQLKTEYDAVVVCGGASAPRDLPIPGRDGQRSSFCDGVLASTK